MRALASIRLIDSVSPIEGADNIEKVTIDGWNCVTKKGEFKPGDLCVYFEIDSFLPIKPEFEFLRKSCYKKLADGREGFRLKTIRLRGTLSQGLALPISIINDIVVHNYDNWHEFYLDLGRIDVTEVLGVTKYEPPIPPQLQGKVKRYFPGFLRKTDQERVQNLWKDIKHLDEEFEVTIKLDGTSCTYYFYDGKFGVCSRNLELEESEGNTLWKLARKYDIENKLREVGRNIAFQGEVIGEGIQGNPEGLIGQEFHLFDIFDIDQQQYLSALDRAVHVALYNFKEPKIPHVKVLNNRKSLTEFQSLEDLLSYANGPSLNNPVREGVVFKSLTSDLTFKVISNEFLLKEE